MDITIRRVAAALAVPSLLCASAFAQLTVGPAGSGATFDQVSDALAAAAPGAVIHVAAGVYEPFVVDRDVSIVGAGSDQCFVAWPANSTVSGIAVNGVPAGETVRISGFGLDSATNASVNVPRIHLSQCDGRVELVDLRSLTLESTAANFWGFTALGIADCDAVVLQGVEARGSHGAFGGTLVGSGGTAGSIVASRVWLSGCLFAGGHGGDGGGGEALVITDGSFVEVSRSEMLGGNGGAHFGFEWWDIYSFQGEHAILTTDSRLVIVDSTVIGGDGSQTSDQDWSGGGPAIRTGNGTDLRYSPNSELRSGANGIGEYQAGFDIQNHGVASVTVVAETENRPTLRMSPPLVAPGDVTAIQATGRAGAVHAAYAALAGLTPLEVPGTGMFVHIDPLIAFPVAILVLDGSGTASTQLVVPPFAALSGLELVLQSIDVDISALRISNPALLTVRQ
jgi:hypothetical protein